MSRRPTQVAPYLPKSEHHPTCHSLFSPALVSVRVRKAPPPAHPAHPQSNILTGHLGVPSRVFHQVTGMGKTLLTPGAPLDTQIVHTAGKYPTCSDCQQQIPQHTLESTIESFYQPICLRMVGGVSDPPNLQ